MLLGEDRPEEDQALSLQQGKVVQYGNSRMHHLLVIELQSCQGGPPCQNREGKLSVLLFLSSLDVALRPGNIVLIPDLEFLIRK